MIFSSCAVEEDRRNTGNTFRRKSQKPEPTDVSIWDRGNPGSEEIVRTSFLNFFEYHPRLDNTSFRLRDALPEVTFYASVTEHIQSVCVTVKGSMRAEPSCEVAAQTEFLTL